MERNNSYDANGNVLTETTPTSERTEKTYDGLNRVTQLTEYAENNSITRQISYSYDANNNVISESNGGNTISYSYDEINRISSVTDTYGKTINYGYDKAGNRTLLTYPGNKTITYEYDNADRLKSLTDWLSNKTEYFKNDAGQNTEIVNGNGTKTNYDYDTAGRLIQLNNLKANDSVISSHNLTLDGASNITQATVNLPLPPVLPQNIGGMTFDNNNRILNADSKSFSHDGAGRIIEENNGVQTIYNFDINDHISSITQGSTTLSSYGYDLNNNRISQTQNGTEKRYVIDKLANLPNVVAETDDLGNVSHYYLYGEGLISQIDSNNNSHYYHYDPTGHTLALTGDSGAVTDKYAYAPYGYTTISGSTHNPFKYVGKYGVMDDGNGLHYMRARYYKEDIKRFMSLDALHGDMMTPQALNRYAYVLGNPVSNNDPSGYYASNDYDSDWDEVGNELANNWGNSNGFEAFGWGVANLLYSVAKPIADFTVKPAVGCYTNPGLNLECADVAFTVISFGTAKVSAKVAAKTKIVATNITFSTNTGLKTGVNFSKIGRPSITSGNKITVLPNVHIGNTPIVLKPNTTVYLDSYNAVEAIGKSTTNTLGVLDSSVKVLNLFDKGSNNMNEKKPNEQEGAPRG